MLGIIGIVVPGLPTTPFVLLAAACFSAGNKRIHVWLRRNRVFGPYIENYHTKQGISNFLKIVSILFLWIGLAISMLLLRTVWAFILFSLVGIGVTIHLLKIKTKQKLVGKTQVEVGKTDVQYRKNP